jgi:GTPase Era involved in 16S rRNA processing
MEEFVWSTGEKYEQSSKKDNPNLQVKRENTHTNINVNDTINDMNNNSMNSEIFRINNKREDANHKLSERYLVGQLNQNPFMINNDYIKDLDVQQSFLMPKNSNNDNK